MKTGRKDAKERLHNNFPDSLHTPFAVSLSGKLLRRRSLALDPATELALVFQRQQYNIRVGVSVQHDVTADDVLTQLRQARFRSKLSNRLGPQPRLR